MVFAEGEAWKHKRGIISRVFNFNFLVGLIPTIIGIVDEVLEKLPKNEVSSMIKTSTLNL